MDQFPAEAPPAERWRFLLQSAIAAPSVRNTQPWRFRLAGDTVTLLVDRSRHLPVLDPEGRELIMSGGAALFHLRLALRHHGYQPDIRLWPEPANPDALATVALGMPAAPAAEEALLFSAISHRHTSRCPLADHRPAPPLVAAMRAAARAEGAWLHTVTGERARREIAVLIAEADHHELADATLQRELSRWMPSPIRTFTMGDGIATEPLELAAGTPLLAILETEGDGPAAWLTAGQALARLLLRAAADGVQASFLNQPLHRPGLRSQLRGIIGGSDAPQAILRLGYAAELEPAPRRRPEEMIEEV